MTKEVQQIPPPTSVSEAARQALAAPPMPRPSYPAPDDTAAWLALVEQTNAHIQSRFSGFTPPVTTEEQEIAGVRVYVAHAHGVEDGERTPIYLHFHVGGLIFGGGATCRLMNDATALTTGMITWGVDYRMPPLHLFPAALDDAIAVYRALLAVRDPADIFVGGGRRGATSPRPCWFAQRTKDSQRPPRWCSSRPRWTSPSRATPSRP